MTAARHELAADLHERIEALAAEARYAEAIATYNQAWALVPNPRKDWEASTWLLAAIGNAAFLSTRASL